MDTTAIRRAQGTWKFEVRCPSCRGVTAVSAKMEGRRTICPRCHETMLAAAAGAELPPASPPRQPVPPPPPVVTPPPPPPARIVKRVRYLPDDPLSAATPVPAAPPRRVSHLRYLPLPDESATEEPPVAMPVVPLPEAAAVAAESAPPPAPTPPPGPHPEKPPPPYWRIVLGTVAWPWQAFADLSGWLTDRRYAPNILAFYGLALLVPGLLALVHISVALPSAGGGVQQRSSGKQVVEQTVHGQTWRIEFECSPKVPKAGEPVEITCRVYDKQTKAPFPRPFYVYELFAGFMGPAPEGTPGGVVQSKEAGICRFSMQTPPYGLAIIVSEAPPPDLSTMPMDLDAWAGALGADPNKLGAQFGVAEKETMKTLAASLPAAIVANILTEVFALVLRVAIILAVARIFGGKATLGECLLCAMHVTAVTMIFHLFQIPFVNMGSTAFWVWDNAFFIWRLLVLGCAIYHVLALEIRYVLLTIVVAWVLEWVAYGWMAGILLAILL